MELEGKVWRDHESSWWLIEISFLEVMTQGKTRKEALRMIKDAVTYSASLSISFGLYCAINKMSRFLKEHLFLKVIKKGNCLQKLLKVANHCR